MVLFSAPGLSEDNRDCQWTTGTLRSEPEGGDPTQDEHENVKGPGHAEEAGAKNLDESEQEVGLFKP